MGAAPVATDIETYAFWSRDQPEREAAFAWLRENDPVSWHPPAESLLIPGRQNTTGFWAVVKHRDIQEVSRHPQVFISGDGIFVDDMPPEATAALSFVTQDAPSHTALRGIVQSAFSPRNIRTMEGWISDTTREVVSRLAVAGEGELVHELTKPLPVHIYANYIGVDAEDEQSRRLLERIIWGADRVGGWLDPDYIADASPIEVFASGAQELGQIALELCEARREDPSGEDLVSWVLNAEYEGRRMTDEEIAAFFVLLGTGANDTVGHAMAHGFLHFHSNPEQLELLLEGFEGRVEGAVEEVLRLSTPIMNFRRRAIRDYELAGQQIRAGDKVVLYYYSGSRDEEVFPDAHRFDILRPNAQRHLAFGGGGPHFCLGASLARSLLKATFREVYVNQMADLALEEPEFVPSNFLNNVKRLPAKWTPKSA
jgi:cytochrome P450